MGDGDIDGLAARAFDLYSTGDFGGAGQLCDQILEADPTHPDGLHLSGLLVFEAGDAAKARWLLSKASDAGPDNPDIWQSLAHVSCAKGDLDRALTALEKAAGLAPHDPFVFETLAQVAEATGNWKRAAEAWRHAFTLTSEDAIPGIVEELPSGDDLKELVAAHYTPLPDRPEAAAITSFDQWRANVIAKLNLLPPDEAWEDALADIGGPAAKALRDQLARLQIHLLDAEKDRLEDWQMRRDERPYDPTGRILEAARASEVDDVTLALAHGKNGPMTWAGQPMAVSVYDLALRVQIIATLTPRTIIEVGEGSGASSLFMAALLPGTGVSGHVHSLMPHPAGAGADRVTFYNASLDAIGTAWPADTLARFPHPWFVVIDGRSGAGDILRHLDAHTEMEDVIMIEHASGCEDDISAFLDCAAGDYRVDTVLTDFFGRNATTAVDSIFRRV